MTVQCTRTTAPKDSADKSTLMREMNAERSQSSITQEPGDEDESEEEIMHTRCTHHLPPKKHPKKSKNRREMKKNRDRKPTCN